MRQLRDDIYFIPLHKIVTTASVQGLQNASWYVRISFKVRLSMFKTSHYFLAHFAFMLASCKVDAVSSPSTVELHLGIRSLEIS